MKIISVFKKIVCAALLCSASICSASPQLSPEQESFAASIRLDSTAALFAADKVTTPWLRSYARGQALVAKFYERDDEAGDAAIDDAVVEFADAVLEAGPIAGPRYAGLALETLAEVSSLDELEPSDAARVREALVLVGRAQVVSDYLTPVEDEKELGTELSPYIDGVVDDDEFSSENIVSYVPAREGDELPYVE